MELREFLHIYGELDTLLKSAEMFSRKKKSRYIAAGKINSVRDSQALKSKLNSENSGLDVGKESPMNVSLSPRKCIPVSVKRKAENSNYRKTTSMKFARCLSNLESAILPVDSDSDFAGEKTQSCENKLQEKTAICDVQNHGHGVLHDLIQSQSFRQAIRLLKDGCPFSQDDIDKALVLACQIGHRYIVQKLVNLGADVQYRNTDGLTPLMVCSRNGFVDLVQFLVTRPADVNAANPAGDTALFLCISSPSSADISKLLLQCTDINIDHQNAEGYTALMKAVEAFEFSTAYILLQHFFVCNKGQVQPWWRLRREIVNCKGETTAAVFEKCGVGKLLGFFQRYIEVKFGDYEKTSFNLNITAWDIDLLNTFFDSACVSQHDQECIAYEALTTFFTSKINTVKIFNKSEIMMVKRLVELGARVDNSFSFIVSSPVCMATEAGSYALVDLLCQHGGNADEIVEYRLKPLIIAAREHRLDLIELLLRHGADINNNNVYSGSALDTALRNGHVRCAKLLIHHGAVVDISIALANAACSHMSRYLNFLLENYPHQTRQCLLDCKDSLLLPAVKAGNIEMIKLVLDAGADINLEYFPGQPTLATTALVESKDGDVARYLIARGADVNAIIHLGVFRRTTLFHILNKRLVRDLSDLEVVRVLLENGASNSCGYKLVFQLTDSVNGGVAVSQLLLDHGADLFVKDWAGNNMLMLSICETCPKMALFLIDYAKDKKDFLNACNRNGTTPLMRAVLHRHATVVKALIDQGVDVNATNNDGCTALLYVFEAFHRCDQTCMDILSSLVSAGSDVNCRDKLGRTVLMQAASSCWNDALLVLLDAGADVNATSTCKNQDIMTALSYALQGLHRNPDAAVSCISTLVDRGACVSYLLPRMLHKLIVSKYVDIMCQLIKNGVGPASIKWCDIATDEPSMNAVVEVSPLCRALACGNVSVATYFVEVMFLTSSDVSFLMYNKAFHSHLASKNYRQCLYLLEEMSSQPMSLFRLAFVASSSAVGTSPGRENRVKMLPLPQMLKDKLLFKSQVEDLPRIENHAQSLQCLFVDIDCEDSDDDLTSIHNVCY